MSDYLSRLIERSLGTAPQIEPLIAPLHSPSEQILREETGTIAPPTAKIESAERHTTPGDSAKGRTTEAAFPGNERQLIRDSPPLSAAPPGLPIEKSDDLSRPRVPLRESSTTLALETSAPLSPAIISQGNTRVVVQPEIIARPGSGGAPEEPPPLPNRESRIAVQPEIIVHRNPPRVGAIPVQPSGNDPPAIHVTIGRVEVRALMAPSAPPKVAPRAAPKLSLEDYLKQRNRTSR